MILSMIQMTLKTGYLKKDLRIRESPEIPDRSNSFT